MKKLFIDLDRLDEIESKGGLKIECGYPYHDYTPYDRRWRYEGDRDLPHDYPNNDGIARLREIAYFAIACRRCEYSNCVNACPKEALEKDDSGILKKYNMRCISCRSCVIACPFGTIYPEIVPYLGSACDFCVDRLKPGEVPLCVKSSPDGIIEYKEIEPDEEKGIYAVGDHLVVKCQAWKR